MTVKVSNGGPQEDKDFDTPQPWWVLSHNYEAGVHEPPKAAKERRTLHARPRTCSSPSHLQNYTLYGKRPWHYVMQLVRICVKLS